MTKEAILGVVRHILTFAGGFAVSGGLVTDSDITIAISSLVTLAGVVWSVVEKKRA